MKIGVPKEIKNNENRVAITPAGVNELVKRGLQVTIENGAGMGSGISDLDYQSVGALIETNVDELWESSEMVVKVKEPIEPEYSRMRSGQILFTYLHLAAAPACAEAIINSGATGIAYETVQLPDRSLPLLKPMSEVAGRLSIQIGANHLMRTKGGRGMLLGGVPGTSKARVVVIGGGVAGEHAAANALGLGAEVTIVDLSLSRLAQLQNIFDGKIQTRASSEFEIASLLKEADLVIGSVLIPGAAAPKLVTKKMVENMKPGSVLVDIAIDQGGCFEGSKPTTHDDPTFEVHNSIYYCVANMPGAVPMTSTQALTNATLPYVIAIAEKGWEKAVHEDRALAAGLNLHDGKVFNKGVADALNRELHEIVG